MPLPNDATPDGWTTTGQLDPDAYKRWRAQTISRLVSDLGMPSRIGDWLLALPDLGHLMVRFMADPEVDVGLKLKLISVVALMLTPQGRWMSRKAGLKGMARGLGALGLGLDELLKTLPRDALERHWAGSPETLRRILAAADTAKKAVPDLGRVADAIRSRIGRRR